MSKIESSLADSKIVLPYTAPIVCDNSDIYVLGRRAELFSIGINPFRRVDEESICKAIVDPIESGEVKKVIESILNMEKGHSRWGIQAELPTHPVLIKGSGMRPSIIVVRRFSNGDRSDPRLGLQLSFEGSEITGGEPSKIARVYLTAYTSDSIRLPISRLDHQGLLR